LPFPAVQGSSSLDWDTLPALYGTQQLGLQPQGIF
jgi:3-hydroxy-9,10-secoandrosta-1,3,5(10)-triene-9,17-dione monooxygenase